VVPTKHPLFLPISYLAILSMLVFVSYLTQPVFAERNIVFEKVVDINKKTLQNVFTDLNDYPRIFPDNIKSFEPISDNNRNRNAVKMVLGLNGFFIDSEIEYSKNHHERHVIKIISGDMKGTKLTTTLRETWGFDGTPNEGTIISLQMTLQFSGLLSLLDLAPEESILYSLDKSLDRIVFYAKTKSDEPTHMQKQDKPDDDKDDDVKDLKQKIIKRGHRKS